MVLSLFLSVPKLINLISNITSFLKKNFPVLSLYINLVIEKINHIFRNYKTFLPMLFKYFLLLIYFFIIKIIFPIADTIIILYFFSLQFDKAFDLSKVHRIDLNILYDHNPKVSMKANFPKFILILKLLKIFWHNFFLCELFLCFFLLQVFLDNVKLVVEQLKSSTNLNLFLASLK